MRRNAPDMTDMTGTTATPGTTAIPGTPVSPDALPGALSNTLPDTLPDAVLQARVLFPRGLVQPVGGFRFSVDALLLAAFAGEALTARNPLPTKGGTMCDGRRMAAVASPASGHDASGGTSGGVSREASGKAPLAVADLGTGCGVVGLALLLAHPQLTCTGIDIDGELAEAARQNAARLGLADRFRVLRADLADAGTGNGTRPGAGFGPDSGRDAPHAVGTPETREFPAEGNPTASGHAPDAIPPTGTPAFDALPPARSMDMVVANPPYRRHGSGRPSPNSQRTRALFETPETLPAFAQAAARLLRTGGRSCWVHGPDRLPDLLLALRATGQEPVRLRCVHARAHGPATLVLVEARRAGKPGLIVEPPLTLHTGEGTATALTAEALAFCPLLACNARGKGR